MEAAATSKNKNQPPRWDCYWIILGAHVMNRVLTILQESEEEVEDHVVIVLGAHAEVLSKILMMDKTKLDKASHVVAS
jgi:hypothetical protein